jgi:hypothetical protein
VKSCALALPVPARLWSTLWLSPQPQWLLWIGRVHVHCARIEVYAPGPWRRDPDPDQHMCGSGTGTAYRGVFATMARGPGCVCVPGHRTVQQLATSDECRSRPSAVGCGLSACGWRREEGAYGVAQVDRWMPQRRKCDYALV